VIFGQNVIADLEMLHETDPEDMAVVQLIAIAKKQRKAQDAKDKQLFGRMFGSKMPTPSVTSA
jgi:hypothetical protein